MTTEKSPVLPKTWSVRWECGRRRLACRALRGFGRAFLGMDRPRAAAGPGSPDPERILVVRLDKVGDNVVNSAFLREFRARFPRAKITLLVRPGLENLVELCPHVDEILSLWPYRRWFWRHLPKTPQLLGYAAWALWPRRFELAINPRWEGDFNCAAKLMFLSRAPRRIAFSENLSAFRKRRTCGYDLLLTDPVSTRLRGHDLQRSLGLVRHLGGEVRSEAAELWLDRRDRERAGEMLGDDGGPPARWLISVGIGASRERRMWPRERFIALLRPYASRPGYRIAILGSPVERRLGEAIAQALGPNAVNLAGRTSLRETTAVLERTRLFIGNNSGTMHMAAAAGCPVVMLRREGLAGARFFPWQVPYRDVQAKSPPTAGDHASAPDPWPGVTVEAVRAAVDDLLAATGEVARENRWIQGSPAQAS